MPSKNWTKLTRAILKIPEFIYRKVIYSTTNKKRRILINLLHRNHYSIIKTLIESLETYNDIEIRLTSTGNAEEKAAILKNLEEEKVSKEHFIQPDSTIWQRWDAHIDLDYISFRIARPSIFIQIFHGNAGKLTKRGNNYSLHKNISRYDYLFCLSGSHVALLKENVHLRRSDSARLIGFTKLDDIANKKYSKQDALRLYNIQENKPTVLYLPSYNEVLSLESIGKELIDRLSSINITLLVKLHPNSYRAPLHANGTETTWGEYLDKLHKNKSITHLNDQLAARYYAAADVLVTDFGSALTEFMVTEKPILYYDTDQSSSIVADKTGLFKIRKATYGYKTPEDALKILAELLANSEMSAEMKEARSALVAERFYKPGSATQRGVNNLREIIGLKDGA